MASIVLVGFLPALGRNAWADRGGHDKHHHYGNGYHHRAHHGHHHGWAKLKRHHHRHGYRHRDDRRPVVIEKHVYHEYQAEEAGFKFAFSVTDENSGVSVEVSEVY